MRAFLLTFLLVGAFTARAQTPPPTQHPWTLPTKLVWSEVVTKEGLSGLVNGETIYYQNSMKRVVARDLNTGKALWDLPSATEKGLVAGATPDLLFLLDDKFMLHALDPKSGHEKWQSQLKELQVDDLAWNHLNADAGPMHQSVWTQLHIIETPMTAPIQQNGRLYFATSGTLPWKGKRGYVYALDAQSGKPLWSFETGNGVDTPPILEGRTIYVGGQRNFYAIDSESGKQEWEASLRSDEQWSSQLVDERLIVSSGSYPSTGVMPGSKTLGNPAGHMTSSGYSGSLFALDIKSGKCLWKYDIGGPSAIQSANGLLVGQEWGTFGGNKLVALNPSDGSEVWTFKEKGMAPPIVAKGRVLHLSKDDKIHILDVHTGKELVVLPAAGTFDISSLRPWDFFMSPLDLDGTAVIASWDSSKKSSVLQSIDLESGKISSELDISGKLQGSPITTGKRLVVLTDKPKGTLAVYE